MTEFVRRCEAMSLEIAQRRSRPFLLAAKVPQTIEGCRTDGFDVATWAAEDLVDIFTLGSRSMDVDVAAFRRITAGHNIKLLPCHDDYHTTDGYKHEPLEFLRGICAIGGSRAADGLVAFNWFSGSTALYPRLQPAFLYEAPAQRAALQEIGSLDTLAHKDKFFAVERRGGYPWAEGFFNRNDTAPLPLTLTGQGPSARLSVRIGDDLPAGTDRLNQVVLRLVLFGALPDEPVDAIWNGEALSLTVRDAEWKDPMIRSPQPQPASGGIGRWELDPEQRLLRVDFTVHPQRCRQGENAVEVRLAAGTPSDHVVKLEKLEVHVDYR